MEAAKVVLRFRGLSLFFVGVAIATIASWFIGFVPLIYMMPIFVMSMLALLLACPVCGHSPFVQKWGPFRVGVPWLPKKCGNCGFQFRGGFSATGTPRD